MTKKLRTDLIIAAGTFCFAAFFFLPASIYISNTNMFSSGKHLMGGYLFLASLLVTALVTVFIWWARISWIKAAIAILTFLTTAIWVQSYLLNWDYGILDGGAITWRLFELRSFVDTTLWLVLFILIVIVGLKKNYSYRFLLGLLLFLNTGNFIIGYMSVYQEKEHAGQASDNPSIAVFEEAFHFSNERNIFVLVLDAYQGNVFMELLQEDPSLQDHFAGFTQYINAVGINPLTEPTLPTFFTGESFKNSMPIDEYRFIFPTHEHFLLKVLNNNGYHTDVHPYFGDWLYRNISAHVSDTTLSKVSSSMYNQYQQGLSDVTLLWRVTLFRAAPHLAKNAVHHRFLLQPHLDQDRDIFVRDMEQGARAVINGPVFRHYHLKGLHQPQVIGGVIVGGPEGTREIARLVNDAVIAFLEKLKALGIYDNSALIIVGDHGTDPRDTFFDASVVESMLLDHGGKLHGKGTQLLPVEDRDVFYGWTWTRALPLILVKPFNGSEPFHISEAPVSLLDIYPTILDLAEIPDMAETEGQSLLSANTYEPRHRKFLFYEFDLMRERYQGFLAPMHEYRVSGFPWYADSWEKTGNIYQLDGDAVSPDIPVFATISNPSFNEWDEMGAPSGWKVLRGANNVTLLPSDDGYEGLRSLHLVGSSTPIPGLVQNIAVPPEWKGKALEFYIFAKAPNIPTDMSAHLYYDVQGERQVVPLRLTTEDDWTKISRKFFLPLNTDEENVEIFISLRPNAEGDAFVGQVGIKLYHH